MFTRLVFANRFRLFLASLSCALVLLGSSASWAQLPAPAPAPVAAPAPGPMTCNEYAKTNRGLHRCAWKKYVSIGPALSALSIGFKDGKIGLFDTAAAVELHVSNLQYIKSTSFSSGGNLETINLSLWEWAFGVRVNKQQDSKDVIFGIYGIPYGIRVDAFAIGIGVLYSNIGSMGWSLDHFSAIVPLTYQFSI